MYRYIIQKNSKYGFINEKGQEVIKPEFERVSEFNEGLAWAVIEREGKWFSGFINENGEWVIEPVFSGYGWPLNKTSLFSGGLAPIQADNKKMMYINKKGEPVTDPIYDKAYIFSENRALVLIDGLYGYIDEQGTQVINCEYGVDRAFEERSSFSHGLAAVRFNVGDRGIKSENNYGYINKNGDVVIEPENYYANAFSEGFAMVKNRFDYYVIDLKGEAPFERTTQVATSFSEGLSDFYDNEKECFGFINTSGDWVIEPKFKSSLRFTEGLACMQKVGVKTKGYIDKNGQIVIPEKFETALPFKNGLAYVKHKKQMGYINKTGEFIWTSK